MQLGDLVWCVPDFYNLPIRGIIVKVIELNPIYNSIDHHYEVLICNEVYTLHADEIFMREGEALSYQMMQLRGYTKI